MQDKTKLLISISATVSILLSVMFLLGLFSLNQIQLSDNLQGGKIPLKDIIIIAIDDTSLQDIGRWPWDRDVFADNLGKLDSAKVVGIDVAFFETSEPSHDIALAETVSSNDNIIMPVEYTAFEVRDGEIYGEEILLPYPELKDAAKDLGYINIVTDKDGVTRSINLDVKGDHDSFANLIYKNYIGRDFSESSDRFMIKFIGPPGTFSRYSFSDLVHDKIPQDRINNSIILIGATSPDLHDDYFVPTSGGKAMPGVEIHATILQDMLTNQVVRDQSKLSVVFLIIIFSIMISLLIYKLNLVKPLFVVIPMVIIYPLVAIYFFDKNIILNMIYPELSIVLTYIPAVILFYFTERKQRKMISAAFEKYVSPQIIEEIMTDYDKLKLGGQKREITVFFSDIRGFTKISEQLDPEQLVNLLNEYLTEMTNLVMDNRGVVDKYMGDAIMAFWGAPVKEENHAELACETSLRMMERLKELQKDWGKRKIPQLDIGIGLNTGVAVVGNMGSNNRFDYTAMGDNINLGSRLESINKQYGTNIIISEFTKKELGKKFLTRELDFIKVKGKNKPVLIYELISKSEDSTDKQKKIVEDFEKAIDHYKKQRWDEAIKAFKKVDDFASKMFVDRCNFYKKNSPEKGWDGSFEMKTK